MFLERNVQDQHDFRKVVPKGGLEPPRVAPYAPQTYVSTSSTTSAIRQASVLEALSNHQVEDYFFLSDSGFGAFFDGAGLVCVSFFVSV
jgi:hypothetical protein